MQIKRNAKVKTSDNRDVGHVSRVVMNPKTREVTHIVVEKGFLFTEDKVVPIDMVASSTDDSVILRADAGKLEKLPPFEETYYVNVESGDTNKTPAGADPLIAPTLLLYPPVGIGTPVYPAFAAPPVIAETEQHIPEGTVALKEGARVIAADGKHVGHVEEVLTDAETDRATDFVISQGILFKERRRVPMHWVTDMADQEVHLAVSSHVLEKLRPYEPQPV